MARKATMKKMPRGGRGRVDPGQLTGRFPDRLYQARRMLDMTQSDLARRVWGETVNRDGYTVARNRDRVSAYEKGKAVPERENLEKLAEALGVEPVDLAPEQAAAVAGAQANPAFRLTVVDPARGLAHLRLDVVVPFRTASRVAEILAEGGAQSVLDGDPA